jgi:septum formation protein
MKLILASQSPRRQELIKALQYDYEIRLKPIDEVYPDDLDKRKVPEFLSILKAEPFKGEINEDELLITSDTIVFLNNEVLGKPKDRVHAIEILSKINGQTHEVITGVSLTSSKGQYTFSETSKVTFKNLTLAQLEFYIDTYKPYDKAGSYAIQEYIGMIGISKIEGCYYNIMGLPISRLDDEIKKIIDK